MKTTISRLAKRLRTDLASTCQHVVLRVQWHETHEIYECSYVLHADRILHRMVLTPPLTDDQTQFERARQAAEVFEALRAAIRSTERDSAASASGRHYRL